MAAGTVVAGFVEQGCACLAVRVTEANGRNVEYIGRVPMDEGWQALNLAGKRVALIAAAKAAREADLALRQPALDLGLSGMVAV